AWPLRSAIVFFLLIFVNAAGASSLDAYLYNNAGLKHYRDKMYFESYRDFLKALNEEPLNPDLQMNLGLTFAQKEEWDKAEKAFVSAYELCTGDKQWQFMALFNVGAVRGKAENIEGALEAYQTALEIEPESFEVKTNIELLLQGQGGQQGKSGKQGGKGN